MDEHAFRTDPASVRTTVLRAVRWSGVAKLAGQLFSWVVTILVIRLLTPDDYGLMAMCSLVVTFAGHFQEIGLGDSLIQTQDPSEILYRKIFGVVVVTSISIYAIIWIATPYIAIFFEDLRVTNLIKVFALQIVFGALSVIPIVILKRRMDFKRISLIELQSVVAGSIVTLTLAYLGYGAWSLVFGGLTISAIRTIRMVAATRFTALPSFDWRDIRPHVFFGGRVTISNILWTFYAQFDVLLVARLFTSAQLGYYSVAQNLAFMPMSKVSSLLASVAFPAYSRIQDDIDRVGKYFLRTIQVASVFYFPLLWGLSSVSESFVRVFLGEFWLPTAILLQLLSLMIPFAMLSMLMPPALLGIGRAEISLRNLVTITLIIPAAIVIGSRWGLEGVCWGWIFGSPVAYFINLRRSLPRLNVTMSQFGLAMAPSLAAAVFMYAAVMSVGLWLPGTAAPVLRLAVEVAVGAVVYCGLTMTINRDAVRFAVGLVRG